MIQPIKSGSYRTSFPEIVIESFNELIEKNMSNTRFAIYQDDVINLIVSKSRTDGMDAQMAAMWSEFSADARRRNVYSEKWLDIEPLYRSFGWGVVYDKPGYNESYKAHWIFTHQPKV